MENFFSWPNPFTLDNYHRLLNDGIGSYFWNSTIITVVSVAVVMLFIPAAAYAIARNMSRKKAFTIMYSLLIMGIFVPFQVIMIPITVMMNRLGLANMWGLIILYLTYAIPQTLFLYVGYIKMSVPDSLDEAAEIDGADKFTTYFKVVFPMLKPMHATTLIINALWFWNDFMLPLLILNKDSKLWTLPPLPIQLYRSIFQRLWTKLCFLHRWYYNHYHCLPHFPKEYHFRNEQWGC